MRLVTLLLALFGVLVLAAAVLLGVQARSFERHSVSSPGVVSALLAGPLYAEVKVNPLHGPGFTYVENGSRTPLRQGQAVTVRYLPSSPRGTARLSAIGPYRTALEVALMGLAMLVMAAVSPWLVARFPHVLAYPVRP